MTKKRRKTPLKGDFCKLPRSQILLIMRIWLADQIARRAAGYVKCTKGLRPRLAAEFGVSVRLIRHIVYREDPGRFRDLKMHKERANAKRQTLARLRLTDSGPRSK